MFTPPKDNTIPEGTLRDIHRALNESSIVAFTDIQGSLTYVNDKFCEISQYTKEELIGKNHRLINSGHHSREFFSDLWRTITSGKVWKGKIKNRAKDGTCYWVFTTIVPFLDNHGKPYQFASIRTEITELKRAEDQRDKAYKDLEVAKIEQELRERFVYMLTHDLRTPLTAAKLSIDLIQMNLENLEQLKALTTRAANNIRRANGMITDLLDANKIRAGQRLPIDVEECNLEETIGNTLENLSSIFGDRFSMKCIGNLRGYWSTAALIRISENLCANGIKYGFSGNPVTVTLTGFENRVELAVHNLGYPISREDINGLFDYLNRATSAQESKKKGWGIGLTLVRGMAEAHGGNVRVYSSESEGTTFVVSIPRDSRPFIINNGCKASHETSN